MKDKKIINNKGITLIALVITIIVLLILAGVSIAMLTGDNGILTQANNAKENTIIGQEKEAISLAYSGCKMDDVEASVLSDDLEDSLVENGENVDVTGYSTLIITFNETNHRYTINQDGLLTQIADMTSEEANKIVDVISNGVYLTANGRVEYCGKVTDIRNDFKFVEMDNAKLITDKGIKQKADDYFLDKDGNLFYIYGGSNGEPSRVTNINGVDVTNIKIEKIYTTNPLVVGDKNNYLYGEGIQGTILENKQIISYSGAVNEGYSGNLEGTVYALDVDGKLYTRGENYYGQLGIGTTENTEEFICLNDIEGNALYNKKIVQYLRDTYLVLVRDSDGKLYSWGHNYYGMLGNKDISIDYSLLGSPKQCYITEPICISNQDGCVLNGKNIIKMKILHNSVFAIDSEGKLYSWGENTQGVLCDKQEKDRNYPVCVSDIENHPFNSIKIVDVERFLSWDYSYAVAIDDNGNLYAWGSNVDGSFGDTTTTKSLNPVCVNTKETSGLYGKEIVGLSKVDDDNIYSDIGVIDSNGNVYVANSGSYIPKMEYYRNIQDTKEVNGEIVNNSYYFKDIVNVYYYLTENGNLYYTSSERMLE